MPEANPPTPPDYDLPLRLRREFLATVANAIPAGEPVALLDFPAHENAGDSAIWLGEEAALRTLNHEVVYRCRNGSYNAGLLRRRLPRGTILLSGGGNLGDIWTDSQPFREQVIADHPERKIVQLPQTIAFRSRRKLLRAAGVFRRHPDLLILARDARSLRIARDALACPAELCPDAAFALGPLRRHRSRTDVLWLARTDAERASAPVSPLPSGVEVADWPPSPPADRRLRRALRKFDALHCYAPPFGLPAGVSATYFTRFARRRTAAACRLLSSGRVVITDRLHGHILCLLLAIPHVVLDNSYGKVRSFHDTWTYQSPLASWGESPQAAYARAEELLAAL